MQPRNSWRSWGNLQSYNKKTKDWALVQNTALAINTRLWRAESLMCFSVKTWVGNQKCNLTFVIGSCEKNSVNFRVPMAWKHKPPPGPGLLGSNPKATKWALTGYALVLDNSFTNLNPILSFVSLALYRKLLKLSSVTLGPFKNNSTTVITLTWGNFW